MCAERNTPKLLVACIFGKVRDIDDLHQRFTVVKVYRSHKWHGNKMLLCVIIPHTPFAASVK